MKTILHSSLLLFLAMASAKVVVSQPPPPSSFSEIMYNSPETGQDSLNFVEYKSYINFSVNWENRYFSSGISFVFPDTVMIEPTILIVQDSVAFENVYGIKAFQWDEGSQLQPNVPLVLRHSNGNVLDSLVFDTVTPWPITANGEGYSLKHCMIWLPSDDVSSWGLSSNNTGIVINGNTIFADPGEYVSYCSTVDIPKTQPTTGLKLYPNTGIFTLDYSHLQQNATLRIRNTLSQILFERQVDKGSTTLTQNIKSNKGIYLLELDDGTNCQHQYMVVTD